MDKNLKDNQNPELLNTNCPTYARLSRMSDSELYRRYFYPKGVVQEKTFEDRTFDFLNKKNEHGDFIYSAVVAHWGASLDYILTFIKAKVGTMVDQELRVDAIIPDLNQILTENIEMARESANAITPFLKDVCAKFFLDVVLNRGYYKGKNGLTV